MKKRRELYFIEPVSIAKHISFVLFIITGLLIIPLEIIQIKTIIVEKRVSITPLLLLSLLLIHPIIGYILTVITCNCYNLVAKKIGGIEYESR